MIWLYILLLGPVDGRLVTSHNEPYRTLKACNAAAEGYQRRWRAYSDEERAGHHMVTFCSTNTPKTLGAHFEEKPSDAK